MLLNLFDLRNEYIKFPEREQETAALIRTFEEYADLPNIAGTLKVLMLTKKFENNSHFSPSAIHAL